MKYKLIKKLPFENSPQIGYISKPHSTQKDGSHYWNGLWFNPENHPEFWEKIIEKNYKILSLARFCSIKPIITDVSNYGDEFIEAMLKCDNARIHSVKRLSDSTVFTIGDNTNSGIIKHFKQFENRIIVNFDCTKVCNLPMYLDASGQLLLKVKTPLFQTFDKIDIFEGDIFYYVKIKKSKSIDKLWEVSKPIISLFIYEPEYEIYFSTKEKAEEYILLNKPCLSYNEVLNAVKIKNKNTFDTLKDLIKQKLK